MDFQFRTGASDGDFYAKGRGWNMNWEGGKLTARAVEAARLAINAANESAAAHARAHHPWDDRTYQTEDSVFVRPAYLHLAEQEIWGTWGVHDIPREPERMNEPTNPEYEARYGGRLLTTKDVALLLEFGFTTQIGWGANRRPGSFVEFPWLYPAWDAEKVTVAPLMKMFYDSLPRNFQYRMIGTGHFMTLEQVFGGPHPPSFATG